ncbi:3-phenylpropionate/trans-cinnamate dioxygenase ferredoxin reductase subunit [Blastococcus sp. DSM 46786]|uniref:NAD(P)/FAD-dependent oxidoreductase n=1 Tax=Blastococcus sp. DSM 46786 TaxID=1798227 RepID=UPI0008AE9567|nr:FAD-dependent oxidoreductase [Blastococcus sp. DSM 46786]SEK91336.1 3-phenylpropionate/trans-cinnamate dioxygenase ferredoxin reductase subunit [Blastococcus sp. DSM 46786]
MPPEEREAGTLVVGASQAGVQLVASLRQLGDTAPITLVGAEAHPPYQRPPLSKEFLAGTAAPETLAFRTTSFYADHDIELICGERVVDVALPSGGRPGLARTSSGRELPFGRLALTVGARPRRIDVPGADLDGILYLRDLDDAVSLRDRLADASRVVVVGGGFIGLEAAAAARAQGKEVVVVEAADRLVGRAVAPVVSDFLRAAHERRGSSVLLSVDVVGFSGAGGHVDGVLLADGRSLPADLVMVGIGVVPRTELAEQLGLECDGGIVVDAHARTSAPSVVAAGDCTVLPHPMTGEGRVRLESVPSAVAQATLAAATLAGREAVTRSVPWFWSNQGDLKLQIAGLSTGFDRHVVRGDPDTESFSVLYYRSGTLLAVDAVNAPADYLAVRKALTQGIALPAELAADAGTPLKALLAAPAA